MEKFKAQREDGSIRGIKGLFHLFSSAAMSPKKYVKKNLPATVTVALGPQEMEMLQIIACRIGTARSNVAHHILKMGIYEAVEGCGFTVDDEGNIPEDQKKWDVTPRVMGISHPVEGEEAK